MDVIEAHARRLPPLDDRWIVRPRTREDLIAGLLEGRVAGPAAHGLDNVRGNIRMLIEQDPDKQFGLEGLPGHLSFEAILDLVEEAAGEPIDRAATSGDVLISPEPILATCEAIGERLALAAERGESMVFATGHPTGLGLFYVEVARLAAAKGARILKPADGIAWLEPGSNDHRQIRYLHAVAMLTDEASPKHTHSGDAMNKILAEARPDLVLADHGFAGAAIQAGIETISIADVNDPALLVARAQSRTTHVLVMDDNVQPDAYWPCQQSIASRFP